MCSVWVWSSCQIYDSYREHMVESYSTVVCWCVIYRFGHIISFQIYDSHRIYCEFLIPKPDHVIFIHMLECFCNSNTKIGQDRLIHDHLNVCFRGILRHWTVKIGLYFFSIIKSVSGILKLTEKRRHVYACTILAVRNTYI